MSDSGLVGVVLVSHSNDVASSTAELARGLAGRDPVAPVAAAGGDADGGFGTSSEAIIEATRKVDQGAGVVVLADLGSAVLTVKALLADGDELPDQVVLADAPFVEGAVAAVVTASTGASLDAVATAAKEAYEYRKA
ncbi:PTS-dependent dihydroxyacetone kinase phosphotransferase subunit DhaM [Wenjunlia tyrosinilytica]|uniref:PTS fructose transporter subunit IIA n=1 Tax=Wenjunlia tyrosinilytica TaxID=1544741 RepID=A0A917ZXD6_9ACTN|nr:PTS fructose transporter subunit IIA [Wenjunlia tyrosinilytica]GGO97057.1 PTS fructose transporter subunit IIA [Wenjunlia tyrosinilytica]